jgi:hypothetical protein
MERTERQADQTLVRGMEASALRGVICQIAQALGLEPYPINLPAIFRRIRRLKADAERITPESR